MRRESGEEYKGGDMHLQSLQIKDNYLVPSAADTLWVDPDARPATQRPPHGTIEPNRCVHAFKKQLNQPRENTRSEDGKL